MDQVRGIACISILKYLRERKGEKAVEEVLAGLEPEEKASLQNIKPKDWASYDTMTKVWYSILDIMGGDKEETSKILARYIAEDNIKWFLQLYLAFATPEKIMKKIPTLWKMYFDKGEVITEKLEKGLCISKAVNYTPRPYSCICGIEWTRYALEKCGAKNIRIKEIKCIRKGDDCCEFESRWG